MAAPQSFFLTDVVPNGPAKADTNTKVREANLNESIAVLLGEKPGEWVPRNGGEGKGGTGGCSSGACSSCETPTCGR